MIFNLRFVDDIFYIDLELEIEFNENIGKILYLFILLILSY